MIMHANRFKMVAQIGGQWKLALSADWCVKIDPPDRQIASPKDSDLMARIMLRMFGFGHHQSAADR